MTAKELLVLNGDSHSSPLLDTLQRLHALFAQAEVPYAVIGGLAVIRNGAARTTHDIDILTRRQDWQRANAFLGSSFTVSVDHAVDTKNGVEVDVLFSGDYWGMLIPLPDPEKVAEYDPELGGCFLGLADILQIKTAVYLQKKRDEGIELAAKDLGDVVELLKHNRDALTASFYSSLHPVVSKELRRISRRVLKS